VAVPSLFNQFACCSMIGRRFSTAVRRRCPLAARGLRLQVSGIGVLAATAVWKPF
jgi:hypothetical protein